MHHHLLDQIKYQTLTLHLDWYLARVTW